MRVLLLFIMPFLIASCVANTIKNKAQNELYFSDVKTDFKLTDANNYGCKKIDISIINHILSTGVKSTARDIHDYYDTTGCSVTGQLKINNKLTDFTFDYGGILYLSNGINLTCGELCCKDGFTYCSWDKKNLRGY